MQVALTNRLNFKCTNLWQIKSNIARLYRIISFDCEHILVTWSGVYCNMPVTHKILPVYYFTISAQATSRIYSSLHNISTSMSN